MVCTNFLSLAAAVVVPTIQGSAATTAGNDLPFSVSTRSIPQRRRPWERTITNNSDNVVVADEKAVAVFSDSGSSRNHNAGAHDTFLSSWRGRRYGVSSKLPPRGVGDRQDHNFYRGPKRVPFLASITPATNAAKNERGGATAAATKTTKRPRPPPSPPFQSWIGFGGSQTQQPPQRYFSPSGLRGSAQRAPLSSSRSSPSPSRAFTPGNVAAAAAARAHQGNNRSPRRAFSVANWRRKDAGDRDKQNTEDAASVTGMNKHQGVSVRMWTSICRLCDINSGIGYVHGHYLELLWLVTSRAILTQCSVHGIFHGCSYLTTRAAMAGWIPTRIMAAVANRILSNGNLGDFVQEQLLGVLLNKIARAAYFVTCALFIPLGILFACLSALVLVPIAVLVLRLMSDEDDPLVQLCTRFWSRTIIPAVQFWMAKEQAVQTMLFGDMVELNDNRSMGSLARQGLYAVVLVPIAESVLFRSWLHRMARSWSRWNKLKKEQQQQQAQVAVATKAAGVNTGGMFLSRLLAGLFRSVLRLTEWSLRSFVAVNLMAATYSAISAWTSFMSATSLDPVTIQAGAVGILVMGSTVIAEFYSWVPTPEDSSSAAGASLDSRSPEDQVQQRRPGWFVLSSLLLASSRLYHWYSHEDLVSGEVNIYEEHAVGRLAFAAAHMTTTYLLSMRVFCPLYVQKGLGASCAAQGLWNAVAFRPRTMPLLFLIQMCFRITRWAVVAVPKRGSQREHNIPEHEGNDNSGSVTIRNGNQRLRQ